MYDCIQNSVHSHSYLHCWDISTSDIPMHAPFLSHIKPRLGYWTFSNNWRVPAKFNEADFPYTFKAKLQLSDWCVTNAKTPYSKANLLWRWWWMIKCEVKEKKMRVVPGIEAGSLALWSRCQSDCSILKWSKRVGKLGWQPKYTSRSRFEFNHRRC